MFYMKKFKKVACFVTAFAVMATMFVGCGKKEEKTTNNNTSTAAASTAKSTPAPEDPLKEHMTISIAYWGVGNAIKPEQEDKVRDTIYKKLNIDIKPFNVTWDDYGQKIQVWAASSQLPDAFAIDAIGSPNYKKWITQGIVRALPEDFSAYPNLKKIMDDPGVVGYKYPVGAPDAKFYAVPRPTYAKADYWANDIGCFVRKDWMQNVGITKEPENMDEFIELMKAFTENDPDKDGKKNTMGLTMYSAGWLGFFFMGYEPGISAPGMWVRDKKNPGKWTQAFMTDDCLQGVLALKKLYASGGMDADFATLKGEDGFDKFATGRAGAYSHSAYPATHLTLLDKMKKNMPDINWSDEWDERIITIKPFKHADGNYYRQIQPTPWSETYINAKCDDKKADRILRLFDYLFSQDGFNLIRLGIEGVDWKKDGDKIVITREKDESGNFISLGKKYLICGMGSFTTWAQDWQYTNPGSPVKPLKVSQNTLDWLLQNAKPVDTDLRVGYVDYPSKDKAIAQFADDLVRALLAKDTEKEWKAMVEEHRKNGYDQVIADFNAEAQKLGIK